MVGYGLEDIAAEGLVGFVWPSSEEVHILRGLTIVMKKSGYFPVGNILLGTILLILWHDNDNGQLKYR